MSSVRFARPSTRLLKTRPHIRPPSTTFRPPSLLTRLGSRLGPALTLTSISRRALHSSLPCLDSGIMPFKLHDIGEGITEVEILKWHVEVGSTVEEFDALCEVQSDKSVVELTSPASGTIDSIKAEVGETVRVGQTICDIRTAAGEESDSTVIDSMESPQEGVEQEESPAVRQAEEETEQIEKEAESASSNDDGKDGELPPTEVAELESRLLRPRSSMDLSGGAQFSGEAAVLPSAPRTPKPHPLNPDILHERTEIPAIAVVGSKRKKALASPAVRTMAARMGVDLSEVPGSGEEGRVTKDDLLAATPGSSTSPLQNPPTPRDSVPLTTRVDFGRTRKVMWRAMGAQGAVPHFGYSHTLDLTPLLPYLQSKGINDGSTRPTYMAADIPKELSRQPLSMLDAQQRKTTLLTFLVKGLLLAMEEHPIMRSRVKEQGDERWLEVGRDASVGVAVSDPKFGLLTPSLPPLSPDTSLSSITTHLAALRSSPTKPVAGAPPSTLTISSVGGLGETTGAMPVLPPGNLAICAVGRASWTFVPRHTRASERPFDCSPQEVEAGGMRAVLQVPVGWSGDHRVLEGAELIAFTESWKRWIEAPSKWLRVD